MNFKSIISKSSLGSSTSSKSSNQTEEIVKLQNEIESLTLNVSSLKKILESRDSAIGTLAREKEKLYVELKSMQRSNKDLQHQLLYEREMHRKEKKYLVDNIKQLPKKWTANEIFNKQSNDESQCLCALQKEIMSKDEVILTLCSKYLKLKKYKRTLQNKYETLQRNCGEFQIKEGHVPCDSQETSMLKELQTVYLKEVCQNVIKVLKENRNSINYFLNELVKTSTSSSQEKYNINLVKVNNDLQFENTQLKLYQVSKIYSGECSKQEESDIAGPSFQNVVHDFKYNEEESKSFRAKNIYGSTINLKNCNKRIYFNKSMSDSNLHRDFYR